MKLELGRMVNPADLEEGDDIYFSCSINANPPAYKLTWWHNVGLVNLSVYTERKNLLLIFTHRGKK